MSSLVPLHKQVKSEVAKTKECPVSPLPKCLVAPLAAGQQSGPYRDLKLVVQVRYGGLPRVNKTSNRFPHRTSMVIRGEILVFPPPLPELAQLLVCKVQVS